MLSSSHLKIHEPHVTGVFPRPADDSTRNCETRGARVRLHLHPAHPPIVSEETDGARLRSKSRITPAGAA